MLPELWQEEIKKLGVEALAGVIADLRDGQREIIKRLDRMDDRHTASETAISKFHSAFPGGDLESHRRYHEELIERNAELRRLRVAIQEKTISGLVWSAIAAAGLAVWSELQKVGGFFR